MNLLVRLVDRWITGPAYGLRKTLFRPDVPFAPRQWPWFYGWTILVFSIVGVLASIPGQTIGVSVFTDHLIEATGLSRLALSNAYLVGTLTSGLLLPIGGVLLDRLGARLMVVASSLLLALTLVYMSASDRLSAAIAAVLPLPETTAIPLVLLTLGFTVLRFSGQGMLTMTSRTTLGKWFNRKRGMVSGIEGVFVSFGFAAAPLVLSRWIGWLGWQATWLSMAVGVGGGMGVLGWLFVRDNPEACGLRMDGEAVPEGQSSSQPPADLLRGFTRSEAIRTLAFWAIALTLGSHAMTVTGITFHIVDIGAESGLPEARTVAIFLPMAIASTLVGYGVGIASDRTRLKYLFLGMLIFQGLGLAALASLSTPLGRGLAILGLGISMGCFGTLSTVSLPRFFGRAHLGAISGVLMMVMVIGSALGPATLAAFRTYLSAYGPGLYAFAGLSPVLMVLTVMAPDPRSCPTP